LSLAAAKATLAKIQREPVTETLCKQGEKIQVGTQKLIDQFGLKDILSVSGHPSWSFLNITGKDNASSSQIKTLFLQEVFARGILTLGTHNISYSHTNADIEKLLSVYSDVFPLLKLALTDQRLASMLRCQPLEPLFKLR
jgi:glutamate-1-semialdehyde 2,1-aminomutase